MIAPPAKKYEAEDASPVVGGGGGGGNDSKHCSWYMLDRINKSVKSVDGQSPHTPH